MENKENNSRINVLRHSMAHIMAAAVKELYPNVKLGFGPAIENGFYYDFDFHDQAIELKDLKKIEKTMQRLIREKLPFVREEASFENALAKVHETGEIYKEAQVQKLKQEGVSCFSFYKSGKFEDLCEGPHVETTEELQSLAFKLDRISGAYWLGSEENKMLTRIVGLCFESNELLNDFLERRARAEAFDHKKLGKELDLFFIDERVGKGLILWTPYGTVIRDEIERFAKEKEFEYGYQRVATPHIAKEELFLTSGHLPAYKASMFPAMTVEEDGQVKEKFYLKPMNCPYHHIIYANKIRSYRDLPVRLAEYGTDYRFEQSGELSGLIRVRCMTMNDAHIYVREDDLENEIKNVLKMYNECYEIFGLKDYYYRLSVRGAEASEKFIGDRESWKKSEEILAKMLKELNIPYVLGEGEAAFYGPKIDIQFKNLMGREETVSTIQVDFQGPLKFDLTYVDHDGSLKRPVIIHRAPLSTHERFLSFLIEYYGGVFPLWLAPVQVQIIPVSPVFNDYCEQLEKDLRKEFLRVESDLSSNSLNKKIRTHVKRKTPVLLIIGNEEIEKDLVTLRRYGEQEQQKMGKQEFISKIKEEIRKRVK